MKQSNLLSILILFFSLLNVQCVVGQTQDPAGTGTWYSYYNDTQYQLTGGVDYSNNEYIINFTYPVNHLEYKAYLGKKASATHPLYVYAADNTQIDYKNLKETGTSDYSFSKEINNTTSIRFQSKKPIGSNQKIYLKNIHVRMAPHIRLSNPTSNTYSFNKTEINTSAAPLTVEFNSFLTKGNLIVETNNNQFLIDGSQTSKTIASGTNILKKIGVENDKYKFTIVFHPTSENTNHQATITIYDSADANNKYTFTVTGEGIKKTPTITWVDNKQLIYGTNLANAATSDCGTAITYSSDNKEVIKIENYELVPVSVGFANITATTAGNDTYKSISATTQFEVTNKTLQEIVWNDIFYDLKIGGANRPLKAYTINSETKAPNNLPITYSVENTNIVKIENGELVIVGLGQTSITATQAGNDEYASISRTMIVIVRENYDDCSGEYALSDVNEYATGDATWGGLTWLTLEKEFTLNTIGDKLSFVANASAGGAATGEGLKVTDQDGNVIYSKDANKISGTNNLQLKRTVKSLKFRINANFRISFSNILVTPAIYLEKKSNDITFPITECGKTGNSSIDFDWANKPDYIVARIIDDASGAFSIADNTNIFGGSCGDYGTSTVKLKFNPTIQGTYTAKLALYIGKSTDAEMIIPITATAIKTPQFITWEQDLSRIKKGQSYPLTATSSSNLDVTYTSSNENIAKIEGNVLTVLGVGNVTITASQNGNDAYEPATSISKNCIAYDDQTITWNQSEFNKTLRIGDVITLNATASSNLDVTYTPSNPSVATVSGNKLTIIGAGEVTITASQNGNDNYQPAPNVTKTITTYQYNVSGQKATEIAYKYVKLTWAAIYEADSYSIYEGDKFIGTTAETNYTITNVNYEETHTYTIKTNDDGSNTKQSSGSNVTVNIPVYPLVKNIKSSNVKQNETTISWTQEDRIANHTYTEYQILVYENGTLKKETTTTNTSITLADLINATSYEVKVGVKYQYELNGTQKVSPDKNIANQWVFTKFSTTDPLTEAPYNEPYTGVINYKGTWYYVNLNNDINITSNPMPIKLEYPCNNLTFKAFTEAFLGVFPPTGNSVGVKQDDTDPEKAATKKWDSANEEQDGKAEINTTTSDLSIYKYSGNSEEVSPLKVKNIWLTIEPHILLKKTKYVTKLTTNPTETETTTAEIDFGEIEIDYNKQVNVNFQSFLSVGDIKAKITADEENVFSLNEGKTEINIAGDNTLEELYKNDHNFTITFNPNKVKEGEFNGTLLISDNEHTVIITLKGKCIKRTPEITWVNDKYISLGEYLAGAAYSTCGIVKYELKDPTKNNIIGIDNDLNLLEGKALGEAEIIAKVEASDKWTEATSTATFTVTDKIIQAIEWNQDFNNLQIGNEIGLTAKAITRDIEEENGNEITYSIVDESVAKIVDGNKLQVIGAGYTYITAHQQGNNEYAPTYMTKLVFVIETAGDSENCWALEDLEEKIYGNGEILSSEGGLNWGPFEFERSLTTLGDKLSFKTTKVDDNLLLNTTGDYLVITDDLGNLVYNDKLGKEETNIQLPDPEATKLTFTLGGNLKISISDIKVTPAKYITPDKNSIAFSETKVDNKAIEEIDFDWANQPDFIRAAIEGDEAGVFAVDTKTAIFGNPECGKYGTSTVKVIFSPKEETEYTAYLVLYVGNNKLEQPKIPITGQGKKAEQSIYWLNVDMLTTADKEIDLARTSASTQQPITYTIVSDENKVVKINEDKTLTIVGEGTFTLKAQQEGNNSYYKTGITEEKKFTATIGNLIFDNKEKDNEWTTIRNWKPESRLNLRRNIEPSEEVEINLTIADNLIIKQNSVVETDKQLSIVEQKGTVTVEPQGKFKVNNIDGTTSDNLILKSSANGNGAFVFASGTPTPSATVEMYSKANQDNKPQWQYMGVPIKEATTSDFAGAWLLKWTEAESAINGDPWSDAPLAAGTALEAWAGYSISQPTATTYTMKGSLMNDDHKYTLTRTESTDPDCGFNLLANSYTAPIDITKLKTTDFSENADACIVLYNTGTYAEWESQTGTSGENPGQLTVIPVEAAKAISEEQGLPTTIPSMQAFFVMAREDGATFTVDYQRAVAGASNHGNQMRAPEAQDEFNVLKIMIKGENSRDQLFLLENENTSKAYDNGYEARKIFDAPRGHQMYATCEYGYASIDCSKSFIGQAIGLKGDNEGEKLTISFGIDKIKDYESLFLYDKATGEYVNIMAEEEYTFYGIRGADDNRFTIVTNPDDSNQTPPFVVIGNELAFDRAQIGTENANIYIYDTLGRLLMTDKVNPGENYRIPDMPEGIYLVSMNGYTTKIVRK
ncbi:MAG: T9SS type A sorting domain-containing protein [Paludibacteraceae bacterium]|nr:T9SS type A sorting domain-containing protein [Paludibacteraceae bacterium]